MVLFDDVRSLEQQRREQKNILCFSRHRRAWAWAWGLGFQTINFAPLDNSSGWDGCLLLVAETVVVLTLTGIAIEGVDRLFARRRRLLSLSQVRLFAMHA